MAEVVVSRQVFFIGAWRTPNVTDKLQQQICKQMLDKEGYSTLLNLTTEGLYLNINDINGQTTKTDRIPLELIADIIDNKFNNTCILAKVKDTRDNYTVFVFLCRSEEDSKAMVQQFQQLKKKLSGEGYNLDMKQSGLNWTLKNKGHDEEVLRQANGDFRVVTTTTTTTNTNGLPDSVSSASVNSDVRDELSDLAKEVRNIKLMMQKSGGRQHFAKHYGYLKSPPPTKTVVNRQVIAEENVVPVEQVSNKMVAVKRRYIKREPEPGVTLIRSRGGQYKQRQTTKGHFIRTPSQSSIASTVRRRVYPSPSPFADQRIILPQNRADSVRFVATQQRPALRREYSGGNGSDIVLKNIEHVYKSKRMNHRIIPVGPMVSTRSETYDYVQSHQQAVVDEDVNVEPVRSIYDNEAATKETQRSVTRVRYVTDGQDNAYETVAYNQQGQDIANASTIVNVSTNNVEDSHRYENNETHIYREEHQVGQEYTEGTTSHYGNGNVIVVQGGGDVDGDNTITTEREGGNVIYIKSEHNPQTYSQPPTVLGGEVYHVRAKRLDEPSSNYYEAPDEREVVIIDREDNEDFQRPTTSSNVTYVTANDNGGLWGAYAKQPDPSDVQDEIEQETAYRYQHDDTEPETNDDDDTNHEHNGADGVTDEVTAVPVHTEKRVRYLDEQLEQTIEDRNDDKEDVEHRIDDVIGYNEDSDGDNEVRDIIDKGRDDVNNNLGDLEESQLMNTANKISDTDLQASKGSVVSELQGKFTNTSESTVLF